MSDADRDRIVADAIRAGNCPFGMVPDGEGIRGRWTCPSGLPGCGCADEEEFNPLLNRPLDDSPHDDEPS